VNQVQQIQLPPVKGRRPVPPLTMQTDAGRLAGEVLPAGEFIEVGCSMVPEWKELHHTAFNLTAAGGLILLIGLAGGWWFVGRALKPVSEISHAATKISAGDLSQRINVAEAESELGQLATVLNSTFARLETAFAQQKQFAADAAHELRTPVAVILTQTQTTLNRERDAAEYKQTVEACQRAAQRMRRLIESLLELARFDAGQEVLQRRRFDFSKVVLDGADLVQTLAAGRRVTLRVDAGPLQITGDPERLGQVVTNLLMNAIQYNHPEGEVRVKLESAAGLAVLTVADTGQGIAAADLPHVFDRFYRADPSRTGAGSAGLGLAICKAVVEAHGGTIEIASEPGRSTVFTVRLPG
jgi:heavy metal sensor kinase